ncbi:PREDICTED: uncharacterized protein LOC109463369 [Branchiostoma belcheri]|uniref:Uncharacterized protein LOC109463369 n=1 Tax=Branchiostoma belcheri TaxID=7741 RepID=A0A6P4YFF7_BRABE|nr:PREDICTED: uncharacterized protein LOC109463369 [Branchiostoma belcheri]
MLTCQSDGTWSGDRPTCIVVQCQTISAPVNGIFWPTDGSNIYQDQLRFDCDLGYVLVGAASITCQADGTWSDNAPICSGVQCPPLAAPANGARTGSNSYQDVVTFTCNLGHVLVGSASLTCQADATWSGNVPTCPRKKPALCFTASGVQCPTLLPPINGGVSGSNFYQDVLTFTCDPGYELEGSASLTCQADATWSGVEPTCTRIQCPALPSPINGDSSGPNFYQDVVQFTCNPGYDLVGDSSSTCQADRTWSSNVPSCNDIDECSAANGGCDHVCTNTLGSFQCSCVDGFNLNVDGHSCDDIDECISANGGCQQNCHNFIGSYLCTCGVGYTLNMDSHTCTDVDECYAASGGCDQLCTNTAGSFQCSCGNGFSLNGDGFGCDDVDECATGNGGCGQICHNLIGSFQCSCRDGFVLNSDGFGCDDVNECSTANGGCDQACTNDIGSFQCSCGAGYSLNADGSSCDDIDECDTTNGGCAQICNNSIGSFECFCRTGYILNVDGQTCDDVDECDTANGGCGQFCNNTLGSFNCYCATGYSLDVDQFSCDALPPPTNFSVSRVGQQSVTVQWLLPARALVVGYRVWLTDRETAAIVSTQYLPESAVSVAFTSLIPATEYVVAVTCVNSHIDGPQANLTIVTDTDAPLHLKIEDTRSGSLVLSWTPPVAKLTEYELTYSSVEQRRKRRSTSSLTLPFSSNRYLLQGLVPATQYTVGLTAVSRFGRSETVSSTGITVTDPPTELTVKNVSSTWMHVMWTPPVAAVVSYDLRVIDTTNQNEIHFSIQPTLTEFNITELFPKTEYIVWIAAVSLYGRSVEDVSFCSTVALSVDNTVIDNDVDLNVKVTAMAPIDNEDLDIKILRLKDQVDRYANEETPIGNLIGIIAKIPPLLQTGMSTLSSSDILVIWWEAIDLLSKSSKLLRATQGATITTMEKMNDVIASTVSSLIQMTPTKNYITIDDSVDLFEMDVIDVHSVNVSPKQQLKNIKDQQLKSQLQLRVAAYSLLNSIDRAANSLMDILPHTEEYVTTRQNDEVAIVIARTTSSNYVTLQAGQVTITASTTGCSSDGRTDVKMVVMEMNLLSWNSSTYGENVTTSVNMVSLGPQNCSLQLSVTMPLTLDFADLQQPRRQKRHLEEQGLVGTQYAQSNASDGQGRNLDDAAAGHKNNATMTHHAFDVHSSTILMVMQLSWWDHAAAFRVFFRYDTPPTEELYDNMMIVQEEDVVLAWHRGTDSLRTFTPNIQRRQGRLYVGIQKSDPRTLLQSAPLPEDYLLQASTVSLDLSESVIRCNCSFPRPRGAIAGSVHLLPNTIEFDNVFGDPESLSKSNIVFYIVISEWALYLLLIIIFNVDFQRLSEKMGGATLNRRKQLPLLSVLPPDRMPAPYLYQVTVTTGSNFGAGTSARIGFKIFGSNSKTAVKVVNPRGESLLRGGIYDLIMPQKTSLGHLELLHIWHDNTGVDEASWFLKDIIVKDLQTHEIFSKAERLSCCWAVFNSIMLASAMWYSSGSGVIIKSTVYDLGFVQFTLQILVIAILASLMCTKSTEKQKTYDINKGELQARLWDHKAPQKVYPPEAASVQSMQNKRKQRRQFYHVLRDFCLLLLFVVVLFYISHNDKEPFAFHASQTLSNTLMEDFNEITTADEFWTWTEDILLPVLYPSFWYNGWKMKYLDRQFPLYTEAFRIGPPLLTQLPITPSVATLVFSKLQQNQWIDKYTQYLILHLSFYYPSLKVFSSIKMTVRQEDIGHLSTSATVETHRLFQYENTSDYGMMLVHVGFVILFLVHSTNEVVTIKREGRKHFRSLWNVFAFLSVVGCAAVICTFGIRYHFASAALRKIVEATGELGIEQFVDFSPTFWWDDVFKHLLAVVVFITTLTLLRVVRFSKTIASFLALPGAMKNDLMSFTVTGAIAFMAFTCSGLVLFGTHLLAYSNVLDTMLALFEMLLGRFFADEILEANPVVGPIFFSLFMILIFIILINFLVTIICDAIASRASIDDDYDQELVDYVWKTFKEMFGVHSPPETDVQTDEVKRAELNTNFRVIEETLNEISDITNCFWAHNTNESPSPSLDVTQPRLSAKLLQGTFEESTSLLSSTSYGIQEQVQRLLQAHADDQLKFEEAQKESRRRAEAMLKKKLDERRMKTDVKSGYEKGTIFKNAQILMDQHDVDEARLRQRQRRERRRFETKLRQKIAIRHMQKHANAKR